MSGWEGGDVFVDSPPAKVSLVGVGVGPSFPPAPSIGPAADMGWPWCAPALYYDCCVPLQMLVLSCVCVCWKQAKELDSE